MSKLYTRGVTGSAKSAIRFSAFALPVMSNHLLHTVMTPGDRSQKRSQLARLLKVEMSNLLCMHSLLPSAGRIQLGIP